MLNIGSNHTSASTVGTEHNFSSGKHDRFDILTVFIVIICLV